MASKRQIDAVVAVTLALGIILLSVKNPDLAGIVVAGGEIGGVYIPESLEVLPDVSSTLSGAIRNFMIGALGGAGIIEILDKKTSLVNSS